MQLIYREFTSPKNTSWDRIGPLSLLSFVGGQR